MVKMFDSYGLKDATARYSSMIRKKIYTNKPNYDMSFFKIDS